MEKKIVNIVGNNENIDFLENYATLVIIISNTKYKTLCDWRRHQQTCLPQWWRRTNIDGQTNKSIIFIISVAQNRIILYFQLNFSSKNFIGIVQSLVLFKIAKSLFLLSGCYFPLQSKENNYWRLLITTTAYSTLEYQFSLWFSSSGREPWRSDLRWKSPPPFYL